MAWRAFPGLRDAELPKYIIVSDFARVRRHDLEARTTEEFFLREVPQRIGPFGFLSGHATRRYGPVAPVDREAAERLGALQDLLADDGFAGHDLDVWMVRTLFSTFMGAGQRADVASVLRGTKNAGPMDYVACRYRKAAGWMAGDPRAGTCFVSTNSITQGEQPAVLRAELWRLGVVANFVHRTAKWSGEARGKGGLACRRAQMSRLGPVQAGFRPGGWGPGRTAPSPA